MKDTIKWCRMGWSETQIWRNYETKPSLGERGSFLSEVTFGMDNKDNRNSPEEKKGHLRQEFWVLYRKVGWEQRARKLCFKKAGRVGKALI